MNGIERNQQFAALILEKFCGEGYVEFPAVFLTYLQQQEKIADAPVQQYYFFQAYYDVLLQEMHSLNSLSMVNQAVLHNCLHQNSLYYRMLTTHGDRLRSMQEHRTKEFQRLQSELREQLRFFFLTNERNQGVPSRRAAQERTIAQYAGVLSATQRALTVQQRHIAAQKNTQASGRTMERLREQIHRFSQPQRVGLEQIAHMYQRQTREASQWANMSALQNGDVNKRLFAQDYRGIQTQAQEVRALIQSSISYQKKVVASRIQQIDQQAAASMHSLLQEKQRNTTIRSVLPITSMDVRRSARLLHTQALLYVHYHAQERHVWDGVSAGVTELGANVHEKQSGKQFEQEFLRTQKTSQAEVMLQSKKILNMIDVDMTTHPPSMPSAVSLRQKRTLHGTHRASIFPKRASSMTERLSEWFRAYIDPKTSPPARELRMHPLRTAVAQRIHINVPDNAQNAAEKQSDAQNVSKQILPSDTRTMKKSTVDLETTAPNADASISHFDQKDHERKYEAGINALRSWAHRRILTLNQTASNQHTSDVSEIQAYLQSQTQHLKTDRTYKTETRLPFKTKKNLFAAPVRTITEKYAIEKDFVSHIVRHAYLIRGISPVLHVGTRRTALSQAETKQSTSSETSAPMLQSITGKSPAPHVGARRTALSQAETKQGTSSAMSAPMLQSITGKSPALHVGARRTALSQAETKQGTSSATSAPMLQSITGKSPKLHVGTRMTAQPQIEAKRGTVPAISAPLLRTHLVHADTPLYADRTMRTEGMSATLSTEQDTIQADALERLLETMHAKNILRHPNKNNGEVQPPPLVSNQKLEEYFDASDSSPEEHKYEMDVASIKIVEQRMEKRLIEITQELETVRSQSTERTMVRRIAKEVMHNLQEQLHLERMRRGLI